MPDSTVLDSTVLDSTGEPRLVVGWHERISLPTLGITSAFAKMDTGADSSCLHARDVVVVTEAGLDFVEFSAPLLIDQKDCQSWPGGGVRRVRAPLVEDLVVRSSNGGDEHRYVIRTELRLGPHSFETHFSLTSREGLRFPVLLGREALMGRFLVDAARSHMLDKEASCLP